MTRAWTEARARELHEAEQLRHFAAWWCKHLIQDWATLHRFGAWRNHPREIGKWLAAGGKDARDNHLNNVAMDELKNLEGLPSFLRFLSEVGLEVSEELLVRRAKHFSQHPHALQRLQMDDIMERWGDQMRVKISAARKRSLKAQG